MSRTQQSSHSGMVGYVIMVPDGKCWYRSCKQLSLSCVRKAIMIAPAQYTNKESNLGKEHKAAAQADAAGSFNFHSLSMRFWDALKAPASFCIVHSQSLWMVQAVCTAHCREAEGGGGGSSNGPLPAPGPRPCTAPDPTPGCQTESCQCLCSGT